MRNVLGTVVLAAIFVGFAYPGVAGIAQQSRQTPMNCDSWVLWKMTLPCCEPRDKVTWSVEAAYLDLNACFAARDEEIARTLKARAWMLVPGRSDTVGPRAPDGTLLVGGVDSPFRLICLPASLSDPRAKVEQ
jgi:hypothetical protein